MKIYIAGPISGVENYKEVFAKVETQLIKWGHKVMNPAALGEGFDYEAYMPICLAMLEACDCVFLLNGWESSKGARLEKEYAIVQGKHVLYVSNGLPL